VAGSWQDMAVRQDTWTWYGQNGQRATLTGMRQGSPFCRGKKEATKSRDGEVLEGAWWEGREGGLGRERQGRRAGATPRQLPLGNGAVPCSTFFLALQCPNSGLCPSTQTCGASGTVHATQYRPARPTVLNR
jgi:hypothetical protein